MDIIFNDNFRMENVPINEDIFNKRKGIIQEIFNLYVWEFDTNETRNRIKRDILKILQRDIRIEKLKKIGRL